MTCLCPTVESLVVQNCQKEDATMEHRIEKNDEGVSPVIAVILMVAITVVLAAVLYVWAIIISSWSAGIVVVQRFTNSVSADSMHDVF